MRSKENADLLYLGRMSSLGLRKSQGQQCPLGSGGGGGDGGGISFSLKAGVQGVFREKSEHIGKSVWESGWEGLEKWEI